LAAASPLTGKPFFLFKFFCLCPFSSLGRAKTQYKELQMSSESIWGDLYLPKFIDMEPACMIQGLIPDTTV
jgi:hypothetical protein